MSAKKKMIWSFNLVHFLTAKSIIFFENHFYYFNFHRDIAARNCLVDTSTLRARLADAALSRDLFAQDYHCLGDNENRPIGWMALETLQHGQYSTSSDSVSWILEFIGFEILKYERENKSEWTFLWFGLKMYNVLWNTFIILMAPY